MAQAFLLWYERGMVYALAGAVEAHELRRLLGVTREVFHPKRRRWRQARISMMMRVSYHLVGSLLVLGLVACESNKASPERAPALATASAEEARLATQAITAVGENYCLGCALKKEQGAAAQCSVYGHRHALRVETATAEGGQPLQQLAGETLHYLDNDQSKPLLGGGDLHNKRVEVKGKLFAPERTLQVTEARAL